MLRIPACPVRPPARACRPSPRPWLAVPPLRTLHIRRSRLHTDQACMRRSWRLRGVRRCEEQAVT